MKAPSRLFVFLVIIPALLLFLRSPCSSITACDPSPVSTPDIFPHFSLPVSFVLLPDEYISTKNPKGKWKNRKSHVNGFAFAWLTGIHFCTSSSKDWFFSIRGYTKHSYWLFKMLYKSKPSILWFTTKQINSLWGLSQSLKHWPTISATIKKQAMIRYVIMPHRDLVTHTFFYNTRSL